jgi:hypothetical protein
MPGLRKSGRHAGAIGEPTRLWALVLSSRQDGGIWISVCIACWTFQEVWRVRPSSVLPALAEAVSHDERELEYTVGLIIQLDNASRSILPYLMVNGVQICILADHAASR